MPGDTYLEKYSVPTAFAIVSVLFLAAFAAVVGWTGSLLAFNRVYQQRVDSHAQKTGTQEFAEKLGVILYEHFPYAMEALNN